MGIIENLFTTINIEDKECRYSYRLFSENFRNGQAYGIEIERQDFVDGNLVKIVRDSVEKISCNEEKVRALLRMLFNNVVSPIHLVDIIGEYVDKYVEDFNDLEAVAVSL